MKTYKAIHDLTSILLLHPSSYSAVSLTWSPSSSFTHSAPGIMASTNRIIHSHLWILVPLVTCLKIFLPRYPYDLFSQPLQVSTQTSLHQRSSLTTLYKTTKTSLHSISGERDVLCALRWPQLGHHNLLRPLSSLLSRTTWASDFVV